MSQFPEPEWFARNGYAHPRQLPDGRWIALQQMLFTTGLVVDIAEDSWRARYCYEDPRGALADLLSWDGRDHPPGLWIKKKPDDLPNPRWLAEAKQELAAQRKPGQVG